MTLRMVLVIEVCATTQALRRWNSVVSVSRFWPFKGGRYGTCESVTVVRLVCDVRREYKRGIMSDKDLTTGRMSILCYTAMWRK